MKLSTWFPASTEGQKMALRTFIILLFLLCFASCKKKAPLDYFPVEERGGNIVMREFARDSEKSSHYVLMNGAERPHFHDRHSFIVRLVSGRNRLHLVSATHELAPGETMRIEKGSLHWAENAGPGFSILQVDFYPPFDGTDRRFAE
ncbi:MAG TPA: hypothetical protein PKM44_14420 [Turneriella sp.]|nr:hypothetical protein [Turneriella sp.]HNL11706.1 hypothetical protein [Turneriella sp.]